LSVNIRKFLIGLGLIPNTSLQSTTRGELEVLTTDSKIYYNNGTVESPLVTENNLTTGAITGTVPISSGGTGQSTQQTALNALAGAVTSGDVLRGNGTNVTMSAIQVSDIPTLNQNTTGTAANITATSNSTLTTLSSLSLPGSQVSGNIAGNAANVTGTISVANGGTGDTSLAAHGVLIGNGTGAVNVTIPGTAGQVLTSNGASSDPTWQAAGTASPLTTKGDLYGYSTTNARLPVGTNGQHLSVDSTQTLGVKWITSGRTLNNQSGTTYTFVLADGSATDGNPLVTATNSAAQTYTIPPNSSVAFPVGTQIDVTQLGAGLVTFAAGAGVTLNSLSGGLTMLGQYSAATLVQTAANVWDVIGTGVNSINLSLSDWTSCTPTFSAGFGTITNLSAFYRRVGDSMEIQGSFTTGTVSAVLATFTIPSGFNIDTTKLASIGQTVGWANTGATTGSGVPNFAPLTWLSGGGNTVTLTNVGNGSTTNDMVGINVNSSYSTGQIASFHFCVPISGWTSTSQGSITAPRSEVTVDTGNGYGSTNTRLRRYSNIRKNIGSDITYADSATLGASFTINTAGIYAITASDWDGVGDINLSICVNDSIPSSAGPPTYAQGARVFQRDNSSGGSVSLGWTGNLNVGDVVTTHAVSQMTGSDYQTSFTIVKVSN